MPPRPKKEVVEETAEFLRSGDTKLSKAPSIRMARELLITEPAAAKVESADEAAAGAIAPLPKRAKAAEPCEKKLSQKKAATVELETAASRLNSEMQTAGEGGR